MGGSGSGRWGNYTPRHTVEQVMSLDIRKIYGDMIPRKYFQQCRAWSKHFSFSFLGKEIPLSDWDLTWDESDACLTIKSDYDDGQSHRINRICLTSTACHYGRERWWFICPSCKRRCTCLYKRYDSQFIAVGCVVI